MLIEIKKFAVYIRKEVTDQKFYRNESKFLHHVKLALLRLGYNCIKKRAWKDGHLVDDSLFCIRDRKKRWMLFDADHALRCISEDFDQTGEVFLRVHNMSDNTQGVVK